MTQGTRAAWPDLIVAFGVVLLGALAVWQAAAIPPSPLPAQVGPRVVPYGVGAMLLLLGAGLALVAVRGGWTPALDAAAPPPPGNRRALALLGAGLLANLVLIGPLGFSLAAAVQFVLTAAAFGSRRPLRDAGVALAFCLLTWLLFTEALGVNIGAGFLEGAVLRALGRDVAG